jgi:hypothetical protein
MNKQFDNTASPSSPASPAVPEKAGQDAREPRPQSRSRQLRRWSVAELIARAVPRAPAGEPAP